ncbi:MAG TPA: acyltransferase [Stellaceae bacterium]|nr:acyltransferase [Stellaceae bacterium]
MDVVSSKSELPARGGAMLVNVQALRALAAFLVVFVHIDVLARLCGFPANSTAFGNAGVDLFFVISGLIMVVTTAEKPQPAYEFIRGRITRIVPLYWTITLIVVAIALLAPTLLQSTTAGPREILDSLAFIPYQRPDGAVHPIVFVGWTLNYEMLFYLIFSIGMLLPKRTLGLWFVLIVLAVAAIAGLILHPANTIGAFYTAPIILEFGAGICLGLMLTSRRFSNSRHVRYPAIVVAIVAFGFMLAGPTLWPNLDRAWSAGIPAFLIVGSALALEISGIKLNAKWLQLLGAASYSIYLTHFFVTQVFAKIALHLSRFGIPIIIAIGVGAFAVVALVGIVAHLRLELPLTMIARQLTKRRPMLEPSMGIGEGEEAPPTLVQNISS